MADQWLGEIEKRQTLLQRQEVVKNYDFNLMNVQYFSPLSFIGTESHPLEAPCLFRTYTIMVLHSFPFFFRIYFPLLFSFNPCLLLAFRQSEIRCFPSPTLVARLLIHAISQYEGTLNSWIWTPLFDSNLSCIKSLTAHPSTEKLLLSPKPVYH